MPSMRAPRFGAGGRTSNGQRSVAAGAGRIIRAPETAGDSVDMGQGVDAHCHVFDTERFPYPAEATYRPAAHEAGTKEQLAAVLDAHGLSHALVVNPTSGYGHDNRCLVAAILASGGRLKGIARVPPDAAERTLAGLDAAERVG